jgi:hypothetical protein
MVRRGIGVMQSSPFDCVLQSLEHLIECYLPGAYNVYIGYCQMQQSSVIHHQLLAGRIFRTFETHSVHSRSGYPLKKAMTTSYFPKFVETPCDVSVSEHTSASGRKILLQKSTANSIHSK